MAKPDRSSSSTAVTAPAEEPKALELPTMPAYDLADLGAGFEDTTATDFLLPFLRPLQKLSPEADPDQSAYIEGARAGTFLNTATHDLVDGKTGFAFVPVHRTHQFLEFVPRDQGGGFVASYAPDDPRVLSAMKESGVVYGKIPFGDGNELVESFNVFGLQVQPDGQAFGVVVPFSSSQIGVYKGMMTKLDMLRVLVPGRGRVPLPMFASRLRITSKFKENKKGSWHLMEINFDGGSADAARISPIDPLYLQAKSFRELIRSGRAKAESEHGGLSASEAEGGSSTADDGKTPF